MAICLRAWSELNTCRSLGMSVGPIPVTAVFAWCSVEGLDREATKIMREVIGIADRQFMEKQASARRLQNITGGK